MSKGFKTRVKGIIYVLTQPRLFYRLIMRETRFKWRKKSKQVWVEWQKLDASDHVYMVRKYASLTLELNKARMKVVSEVFKDLGSGLTVLDVGCGDGTMGEHVARMGNNVVSIDLPEIVAMSHGNRVLSLMSVDAEHLAFGSESFDAILALDVLDHLWKPESFLSEAFEALKNNSTLIISAPEGERGMDYDAHKNFFTVKKLKEMLGTRFAISAIKRVQPVGTPTPMIIWLLRKTTTKA